MEEHNNAANPKGERDNATKPEGKQEARQVRHEKMLDDLRAVLKLPQGRRYITDLLRRGYLFDCTFTGNSRGAFLEGNRNFAMTIREDIRDADQSVYREVIGKIEEEYDA